MYTQITTIGLQRYLVAELPTLLVAFVIAEVFYKFGSFALECTAFLATWAALSWIYTNFRLLLGKS